MESVASIRGTDNPLNCLVIGNKMDLDKGNDTSDMRSVLDNHISIHSKWIIGHYSSSSKENVRIKENIG